MNNLIYIVYDRGFRLATNDFKEAIKSAFCGSSLVVYDMDNKKTLLDFYCEEDTLYELECELIERELFNIIPESKQCYKNIKDEYETMWKKRDDINKKRQEEHEYEIYLKVKERLALD